MFKLLLLLAVIGTCNSYRILGLNFYPQQSHFLMMDQLLYALASKGHQVDFISTIPPRKQHPNYKHIITLLINDPPIFADPEVQTSWTDNPSLWSLHAYVRCEMLAQPELFKLAHNPPKDPPYDLVILQVAHVPCLMVLGHLWNIPVILVSTSDAYPWMHDMVGNPENVALSPHNIKPMKIGNSFWDRIYNVYEFYRTKLNYLYYTRNQDELLKKYFGPEIPSVRDLERNTALMLVNRYFPINGVKPATTGFVEVGGIHIEDDGSELSKDLKQWLDESKSGVVYFSFGSIFSVDRRSEETIKIIFDSLEKISPVRVLMRIANPENIKMKIPKNIRNMTWMPQQKIFKHPNVKVFITHCGLLGSQEAIYFGVPMLCMPYVFDQWINADIYVNKKIAVKTNSERLTKEDFDEALHEILNNPIYRENIKKYSKIFRDRPQSAMDTAIFWIEYVARNGKESLRSPAMDLTWWQIALLDIIAVTFVGLFLIIYIIFFIVKTIFKLIVMKKNIKIYTSKKLH